MNRLTSALPRGRVWNIVGLLLALLIFFVSLELLGDGFQLLGEDAAEALLATTRNPITGVFTGILATTLLQSSSTTTSMTVALVAAGAIDTAAAIPVMLGANIGTSVTNTIVALGHIRNHEEFVRAFKGAMVLDFFNIIAVLIFLPLELTTNILSWSATQLTNAVVGMGGTELFDPLGFIVDPIAELIVNLTGETGWLVLIIAIALLYLGLRSLVKALKAILNDDLKEKIKKYLFKTPWQAMLFGLVITVAVQSSSITTSVIIPLIALAVVATMQALPYFLGANIGTSTTALLAGLALAGNGDAESIAALNVAWVHMIFDIYAIILLFPIHKIRHIPVWLAERAAEFVAQGRAVAVAYVALVFYLIPFGLIWTTQDLEVAQFYEPTVPQEVQELQTAQDNEAESSEEVQDALGGSNGNSSESESDTEP
ncbi:MAG: Na/Pi symporter [Synechococcales cyanobacterium C42_A2020_086]|jgi:sodium-dependent phosphate cotransporter|nr:Na/Pi symporter [Synechococcales cyanobacterium C42_A2020_086]